MFFENWEILCVYLLKKEEHIIIPDFLEDILFKDIYSLYSELFLLIINIIYD